MPDVSVKMGVSGIAQFKQGMNEAQASVKTLDAALKANEKQFQRTGNAEEHYAAQTTLLNQKLKQQKEIIANAEKALKQMEQNGVSKNSTAYQKMQKTLIEATDAMMDTQDQLDSLGSKAEKTAEKTDKLSSSLGGLNKRVSLDQVISAVGSITSGLENAGRKAVQFGEQLWNTIMDSARRADDTATMADMYGIPLERYLQMQRLVGDGMDTTVNNMLAAQDKLKRGMGNQTVLDELEKIGVSAKKAFGDEGVGDYQLKDSTELFWEAGQALMALGKEYDKEAIATTLFGKSWKELTSLFENYDSLEEYNKALDNTTVNDEETIRNLAALNDAVSALESSWTVLKDEVLGALAPALEKGATAISGLLDSLTEYLKSDDGKELLESMGKAVEGLFKDISEIDPQEVVEGFTGIFNKVIEGFQWLEANRGTVIGALEAIVAGWGVLKLTGGALEIYQLIQGITGLAGGGTASAAAAAGAAAGTSWGGAFAAAVLAAAPWLLALLAKNIIPEENQINNEKRVESADASKEEIQRLKEWVEVQNKVQQMTDKMFTDDFDEAEYEKLAVRASELGNQVQQGDLWSKYWDYVVSNDLLKGGNMPTDVLDKMLASITESAGEDGVPIRVDPQPPGDTPERIKEAVGIIQLPVELVVKGITGLGTMSLTTGGMPAGGGGSSPVMYTKGYANGLPMVPFDGYPALLHKGEQVIPAREVEASRNYSSNLYVERMYMNNGTDAAGLAAAMAAEQKRTADGYGG